MQEPLLVVVPRLAESSDGEDPKRFGVSPEPGEVSGFRRYKVSSVGQLTLPATARHRWRIERGGRVEVADLGFGVLILPERGSSAMMRSWLLHDETAKAESDRLLRESRRTSMQNPPRI